MNASVAQQAEELATLMRERLGVRGGAGFRGKLKSAGRRLPRWARRHGRTISSAIALEAHPKLQRQIDRPKVEKAIVELRNYLDGVDPWERRRGRILDWLAVLGLIFVVTVGLLVYILNWRGLI